MSGKTSTVSPSNIKTIIKSRAKHKNYRTPMIVSSPGLGKTQICKQVAEEIARETGKDFGFLAVHAPTLSQESVAIPLPNEARDSLNFVTPRKTLPFEGSDFSEEGILLIDELPQGGPDTQKILANIIQDRNVYGNSLLPGWTIVATGNRQEDKAGASAVLSHLSNRLTTLEMRADIDDWQEWFKTSPYHCVEGAAFLAWRPDLLSKFDPNQRSNPTPRAWAEGVFAELGKVPPNLELAVFEGDVGTGAASEFVGFLRVFRELPRAEDVFKDPENYKLPTKPDVSYALAALLASKTTDKTFKAATTYVGRMSMDLQVVYIRGALGNNPKLGDTKEFDDWITKNQHVLTA